MQHQADNNKNQKNFLLVFVCLSGNSANKNSENQSFEHQADRNKCRLCVSELDCLCLLCRARQIVDIIGISVYWYICIFGTQTFWSQYFFGPQIFLRLKYFFWIQNFWIKILLNSYFFTIMLT